jgi:hypothetical protein
MTLVRIRRYGQTEVTDVSFSGEFENELAQQFLSAIRMGLIWPSDGGEAEDLHLLVWSDELGQFVEG